jgi:hypothetical protein
MYVRPQGWLLPVLLVVGCAHSQSSGVWPPPGTTPPPRTKLAVLPVDADQFPQLAASLNSAFRGVRVAGVDDYFLSKVTLEVVQLSIECVQPSSECYKAVGKSLSANKLLLGHVVAAGKRKRDKSVRVTLTLFNVDTGEAASVVDRVYKTPELASQGAQGLVAETASPSHAFGPDKEKSPQPSGEIAGRKP